MSLPKAWEKYPLYEASVQSPEIHAEWIGDVYKELRGKPARSLREDFCGTFKISCEWIKRHSQNTALGLDIDPEPLAFGKAHYLTELTPGQRARIKILRKNVLSPISDRVDVTMAFNFSICFFHERNELVEYFRKARKGLRKGGMLLMDLAGGPGMINEVQECKRVKMPTLLKAPGLPKKFTYVWHQQSFNPVLRNGKYAIHFRFPGSRRKAMTDAFTYDWRMWTIPEVRDALTEAGFKDTACYWETEFKGRGTGEFLRVEEGDNATAWIAYIAGLT